MSEKRCPTCDVVLAERKLGTTLYRFYAWIAHQNKRSVLLVCPCCGYREDFYLLQQTPEQERKAA